jgi:hypothetical protein
MLAEKRIRRIQTSQIDRTIYTQPPGIAGRRIRNRTGGIIRAALPAPSTQGKAAMELKLQACCKPTAALTQPLLPICVSKQRLTVLTQSTVLLTRVC